jgi:hypothetical protein
MPVDKITSAALDSGVPTRAQLPAGSVLQVVNATATAAFGTTSTSFVATNSTATITPTSATSKILILTNCPLYGGGTDWHIYTSIYRGTTNLAGSTYEMQVYSTSSGGVGRWSNGSMSWLDSPNTTSPTTYTVYLRTLAGGTVYYGLDPNVPKTITLMEIAG